VRGLGAPSPGPSPAPQGRGDSAAAAVRISPIHAAAGCKSAKNRPATMSHPVTRWLFPVPYSLFPIAYCLLPIASSPHAPSPHPSNNILTGSSTARFTATRNCTASRPSTIL
jgi:hypothetical protein